MVMALAVLATGGCTRSESPALAAFHTDVFDRAFNYATLTSVEDIPYEFHTETLGELEVSTGRIGALEPFSAFEYEPFTVEVPRGRHTTQVALARHGEEEIIAFARVRFSNERAAYWKLAVWPRTDTSQMGEDRFAGYPVDGGTGSFMDAIAAEDIVKQDKSEAIIAAMEREYTETRRQHLMFKTERSNVAVFATGIGDGAYASYFGFSQSGKPVVLVTDFGMIPWKPAK